jgi:mannitol-1-/sugar-/sorbitol-6-phosphatase
MGRKWGPRDSLSCQAVLFDMDGVLADSAATIARLWRAWAVARDLPADDVVGYAYGRSTAPVLERFAPHLDAAAETAALLQAEAAEMESVSPLPGALALVRELSGAHWAVVTSCPRGMALRRLEVLGIAPPVLIAGDSVQRSKPHPEGYLRGAAALGVPPAACIVFEDAPAGIEAGRAAGATVIALLTTHPVGQLGDASLWVDSLRDVRARQVPDGPNGDRLLELSHRPA